MYEATTRYENLKALFDSEALRNFSPDSDAHWRALENAARAKLPRTERWLNTSR